MYLMVWIINAISFVREADEKKLGNRLHGVTEAGGAAVSSDVIAGLLL